MWVPAQKAEQTLGSPSSSSEHRGAQKQSRTSSLTEGPGPQGPRELLHPSTVATYLFMVLFCFKRPRAHQGHSTQRTIQAS